MILIYILYIFQVFRHLRFKVVICNCEYKCLSKVHGKMKWKDKAILMQKTFQKSMYVFSMNFLKLLDTHGFQTFCTKITLSLNFILLQTLWSILILSFSRKTSKNPSWNLKMFPLYPDGEKKRSTLVHYWTLQLNIIASTCINLYGVQLSLFI